MRLSDEVIGQLARVWCSECGRPSIYPDDEFFAHYETHCNEHSWKDWWDEQRRVFGRQFHPYISYIEYAYREEGWK